MFIFDMEVLFLASFVVFNIGVIGLFVNPESAQKKITFRGLSFYLSVVLLFIILMMGIIKFAPELLEPPSQNYRIVGMAAIHLLCFIFLWSQWFKTRKKI